MRNRTAVRLVLAVLAVHLGLLGCGDSQEADLGSAETTSPPTSRRTTPTTLANSTDETATVAPPGALTVDLTSYKFTPSTLEVKAGTVAIFLTNLAAPPGPDDCARPNCEDHNFDLRDADRNSIAKSARLVPGSSGLLTIEDLPPGQYEFRCSILAHYEAFKMSGTLTVLP
jgi:uncharacterized cupredoxin-like copper-binding protein